MKSRSTANPTPITSHRTSELEEKIRVRAFEIYEQRGRDQGRDIDDWLQAEAEVSGKSRTASA